MLYDVNGVRLAVEGALDEGHLERMDEFALWALGPYQEINKVPLAPVHISAPVPVP